MINNNDQQLVTRLLLCVRNKGDNEMERNLALGKVATASSWVLPYTPDNAVSGIVESSNRWVCKTLPGSLTVDLGDAYWINTWAVFNMGLVGWSRDYNMETYSFHISNDLVNWEPIDRVEKTDVNISIRNFKPKMCRYIQLQVESGQVRDKNTAACLEFQVYEAPDASANLEGLAISSGNLSPDFSPEVYEYEVNTQESAISIMATAEASEAAITVNGVAIESDTESNPISLIDCGNLIEIVVASKYGQVQRTYRIQVQID